MATTAPYASLLCYGPSHSCTATFKTNSHYFYVKCPSISSFCTITILDSYLSYDLIQSDMRYESTQGIECNAATKCTVTVTVSKDMWVDCTSSPDC
jgi:hypothetical protein